MTPLEAMSSKVSPYVFMCIPTQPLCKSMDEVIERISTHTGVEISEIRGHSREHDIRQARQMFMTYCVTKLGITLKKIAGYTGHDHTTVIHSRNVLDAEMKNNTPFGELYKSIFRL